MKMMILILLALFTQSAQAAYNPDAIDQLTGDVTAIGNTTGVSAATVASVGGVTASNVATGANAANAASALQTPNVIAKRNGSGNNTFPDLTTAQGNLSVNNLNSGTGATATTFWAGNGTWETPATSVPYGSPTCTVTISVSTTIVPSDCIVLVNAAGGAVVVTLYSAAAATQATSIKKIDSSANTVTIVPPTGTLDGVANYVETEPNFSITVTSDLTNFWIQ